MYRYGRRKWHTKELTSYVNCVAWNEYADQYISAMADEPVNVEGRLTTRSYEKMAENIM